MAESSAIWTCLTESPVQMKRAKTQTEIWLIQQMWTCRREINLYKTDAYMSNPTRYAAIGYMKRCQAGYRDQLRRHRQYNGIIPC